MKHIPLCAILAAAASAANLASATTDGLTMISDLRSPVRTEAATQQEAKTSTAVLATHTATTKEVTETSDLAGAYVMTFETLLTSSYDGGFEVNIETIEDTDSIAINDYWASGLTAKAKVDLTEKKIYIPNQIIGTVSGYGDYELAYGTEDGSLDRTLEIEGDILDDGSISITSPWAMYIPSGYYAGYLFGVYYNALIEPANGTMSYVTQTSTSTATTTFNVLIEQTSYRTITVKNFANYGHTVEIDLLADSSAVIHTQLASTNYYGDWYTYSATFNSAYSTTESYNTRLDCNVATDARTISWGGWTLICAAYSYFTGCHTSGSITADFDITYPTTALALDGEGTETSPYIIESVTDWDELADYIANYADSLTGNWVKLGADIDFGETEPTRMGYDLQTVFNGTLDGNGKTIKGITLSPSADCEGGLFLSTGPNALLSDFTAEGTITTDTLYTGGIVGIHYGTMRGVTGKMTITASQGYAAGIAGYAATGSVFEDCAHEGEVTSADEYFAGIAAFCESGVTFESCVNRGTLTYTGDATTISGASGIAAYCYPSAFYNCYNCGIIQTDNDQAGGLAGILAMAYTASGDTTHFIIKGCYNTSDFTSAFNNGGVVLTGSNYTMMIMEDCYNTGNMTSTYSTTSSSTRMGGVAAFYFYDSTYRNCWNSGAVTSAGTAYVGGVFGGLKKTGTSEDYRTTITACYNSGAVSGGNNYVGGVVGYQPNYVTVDSCYNLAEVYAAGSYVGGVVGGVSGKACVVSNCWNIGNVTTAQNRAGGVIGYNTVNATVANCFNMGDVASTSELSGVNTTSSYAIGGVMGLSASNMTNVYNIGNVTGISRVGGIVGQPYKGLTTLNGAYTMGQINATSGSCGNIIGVDIVDNTSFWTSANSIASTYYLSEYEVTCADTVSTGLSRAELGALELDGWINGDSYSYPILADNDYAKAYAAAVIVADGDSYSSVTTGFNVGTPDGVTWTASPTVVEFSGNDATFTESYTGILALTATCGEASVTTSVTCNVELDGISSINSDSREIVSEKFYTITGVQVAEPIDGVKAIYIVATTYDDGTTTVAKQAR